MLEHTPKLCVIVYVTWIKVVANGALKQSCILGNYRQTSPEVQKSDSGRVEAINTARLGLVYTSCSSV